MAGPAHLGNVNVPIACQINEFDPHSIYTFAIECLSVMSPFNRETEAVAVKICGKIQIASTIESEDREV